MIKKAELQQDFTMLMDLVKNWRLGTTDSVESLLVMHEALKRKHSKRDNP